MSTAPLEVQVEQVEWVHSETTEEAEGELRSREKKKMISDNRNGTGRTG